MVPPGGADEQVLERDAEHERGDDGLDRGRVADRDGRREERARLDAAHVAVGGDARGDARGEVPVEWDCRDARAAAASNGRRARRGASLMRFAAATLASLGASWRVDRDASAAAALAGGLLS